MPQDWHRLCHLDRGFSQHVLTCQRTCITMSGLPRMLGAGEGAGLCLPLTCCTLLVGDVYWLPTCQFWYETGLINHVSHGIDLWCVHIFFFSISSPSAWSKIEHAPSFGCRYAIWAICRYYETQNLNSTYSSSLWSCTSELKSDELNFCFVGEVIIEPCRACLRRSQRNWPGLLLLPSGLEDQRYVTIIG